jgi:GNAT superfamily N-acetyltransferase
MIANALTLTASVRGSPSRTGRAIEIEPLSNVLARATSDLASFAWLGDVVVEDSWRGKGIGGWLVASVVEHLASLGVGRFVLATRDAHGVYERVGFGPLRVPATWMEIDNRANRPSPADVQPRR